MAMKLTQQQIKSVESLNEQNQLVTALKKLRSGKTLTQREIGVVRRSQVPGRNQDITTSKRFFEEARKNTEKYGQRP